MGIVFRGLGPRRRSDYIGGLVAVGTVLAAVGGCGGAGVVRQNGATAGSVRGGAAASPRFTVAGTGDFLLHDIMIGQGAADARARGRGGYDFMPMLGRLQPVISRADLGICHIETPLARRSGPFNGYPSFNSPPQIVDAIRRLGYDTCSTASNHSIDQGAPGVRRTLAVLDAAGIRHAGSARSVDEARRINLLDVKGTKVAHLSYAQNINGNRQPATMPWLVNGRLDADRILADAARARSAGAAVVIVSLHWGQEYQHAATPVQRRLAAKLLRSPDVDLIIGHHAHVVQPFEQINGKWVAYGVGNQVANPVANDQSTHEGLVAQFTFTRDGGGRWRARPSFVPTVVVPGPPIRLLTLTGDSGHRSTVRRTTKVVRSLGAEVPVATEPTIAPKAKAAPIPDHRQPGT